MQSIILMTLLSCVFGAKYNCGLKNSYSELEGKILGGHEADQNEYPWQVSLQYRLSSKRFNKLPLIIFNQRKRFWSQHYCGGSLIDPSWIVTAAHCVDGMTEADIVVKAGKQNLDRTEDEERWSDVEKIIRHKFWGINSGANDIALLKLKEPFQLSTTIGTICLPNSGKNTTGMVTITGWGATKIDGPTSKVLMEVDVPTVSDEECRNDYSKEEIWDSMICAGYSEGGFDSCQGDSGGPMIASQDVNGTLTFYLAGIVSWGEGCGLPNKPGVYTEVAYFYDWIYHQINLN